MEKFGSAVILAGGKSTRMGFDKQFLEINERRLIENLRKKLKKDFDEIIVVTNKIDEYKEFDARLVEDIIPGKGPLAGIHSGLSAASSQYVYFIACDMPNISLDYISYMKNEIKSLQVDACVTKLQKHIEPFNAFYSKDMIKNIEEYLLGDKRSIKSLLDSLKVYYVEEEKAREFSPSWEMFLNLNTKEDLDDYLKYMV